MAKRIVEIFVDDISGETLGDKEHETIVFGLDGVTYRIDLGARNARKLRSVFEPYISAGVKVRKSGPAVRSSRGNTGEIRAWAAENGFEVSSRGRVPARVFEAYQAAH